MVHAADTLTLFENGSLRACGSKADPIRRGTVYSTTNPAMVPDSRAMGEPTGCDYGRTYSIHMRTRRLGLFAH